LQRNILDGIEIDQITLFLLVFADDVVLLSETPEGLQRSLDAVYDYGSRWSLAVNCDKTKIMVFKKQPQGLVFTYTLFDAFVGSTMSYGVDVCGFKQADVIERVHLKFFKRILGVTISTCKRSSIW
jgi:hypothetical protein